MLGEALKLAAIGTAIIFASCLVYALLLSVYIAWESKEDE